MELISKYRKKPERKVIFRPAVAADSPQIAELFHIASDGVADYVWSKHAEPGQSLLEVGSRRYARRATQFSYENCVVGQWNGEVIAMMHSFPISANPVPETAPEPDPVLRPYSELEISGSFYISGMAVAPKHQGNGLGTRMLAIANSQAREEGALPLSLLAFEENEGAVRLYRAHGFRAVDQRKVVPHPFIRRGGNVLLMAKESKLTGDDQPRAGAGQPLKLNQSQGGCTGPWNI